MVDPYRERRQRAGRGRPRPTASGPEGGSSPTRWLAGAVLVLLLLIVLGRARSTSEAPVAPPPEGPDTGAVIALPPAPAVQAAPAPAPSPLPEPATAASTPTLDMMVRVEARRRIGRAGRMVYLDTLFAESDSTLRRWPERPGEAVRIAFVRDSVFEAAGDPDRVVREAFGRWTSLRLGVNFEFVSDTVSADILVAWTRQFAPEERRTGQTDIEYAQDGTIQHGRITLALLDPAGRRLDRAGQLLTAAHEVGHVLGLAHSDSPGDLMYPSPRAPTLSNRDTQTALLIYGLPAGSVKGQ